jgi:hypothetical protein
MTILLVGVCVDGKVRKNGFWLDGAKKHWGITSPTPCEKCGGKGCPKPGEAERAAGDEA